MILSPPEDPALPGLPESEVVGRVASETVQAPRTPRRSLVRALSVLVVAVSLAAVSSCSGSSSGSPSSSDVPTSTTAPGPTTGGILDIAVPVAPARWSPTSSDWTTSELQAARAVYDRLMARDANDQPVPELLEKITASSNFSVWTLKVRSGISFHDGTALDAAIVAFNLEQQVTAPGSSQLLTAVSSISTPDASTVVITMAAPWSTFPEVLTGQIGTIAAPTTVLGTSSGPIGTGPFIWTGTDLAGGTDFVKNTGYWKKGLPRLDAVRLVPIAEGADRVTAVIDGVVDMTAVDEPRQLTRIENLPNRDQKLTLFEDRNAEKPKVNIALDTGRAPFDRVTARRAIALATDRAEILKQAFDGQGAIARGMVSDTSPWFTDYATPARDVDRARKQVEEYSKETGLPLSFHLLVPPDTTLARVASVWRVQLAAVGIDVVLDPVDEATIALTTFVGQYQSALMLGFSSSHPDAYEPLFRGIPAEQQAVTPNITRYINPVVTKAFADARSTSDAGRQVDDYRIVQEQVSVDVPYLFLVQVREVVIGSNRLRDVTQWSTGSGGDALGQEAATVSLAQIWIAG